MLELEYGLVKFIDDRPAKYFGFLDVLRDGKPTEGEGDVFFHVGNGQFVKINKAGNGIDFIGRRFGDNQLPMWVPRVGDLIAFQRVTGSDDRPKASPWTYGEAAVNRFNAIKSPVYMLHKEIGLGGGGETPLPELICVGMGADELSSRYPVRVLEGELDDPLAPTTEDEVRIRYSFLQWFATKVEDSPRGPALGCNGVWREVTDPRYRPDHPAAKI